MILLLISYVITLYLPGGKPEFPGDNGSIS